MAGGGENLHILQPQAAQLACYPLGGALHLGLDGWVGGDGRDGAKILQFGQETGALIVGVLDGGVARIGHIHSAFVMKPLSVH